MRVKQSKRETKKLCARETEKMCASERMKAKMDVVT